MLVLAQRGPLHAAAPAEPMAAGLVPQMEKGNQKARDLHIALNCVNLALFTWQIPTGLEIVGKVFQFTSWP